MRCVLCSKWEARVDRSDHVAVWAKYGADQWVQQATGVVLAELWVKASAPATMIESCQLQQQWYPLLEATRTQSRRIRGVLSVMMGEGVGRRA